MLYSKPLDVFKEFNDNPNLNNYNKNKQVEMTDVLDIIIQNLTNQID